MIHVWHPMDVTSDNIFYGRFTITPLVEYHYKYDGKFIKITDFDDYIKLNIKPKSDIGLKENEVNIDERYIGDYVIAVIVRVEEKNMRILVSNNNSGKILKSILMENAYPHCEHYFYYYENKLSLAINCDNYDEKKTEYIKIIEVDINGKVNIYDINNNDIKEDIGDIIAITHENYILYRNYDCHDDKSYACIYDYVKKEIIAESDSSELSHIESFVKLKEKNIIANEKSIVEKIYGNEETKDIKLITKDGILKAHKIFLMESTDYFKKIFSKNFLETDEIKFDIEIDILRDVLEYLYIDKLNIRSINQLIKIMTFSNEILFHKLENKIAKLLFDVYQLDENCNKVKIYEKEFLKDLPKSIKTITFDKYFNESIDGLIKGDVEKLIFGKEFNKDINEIPKSVKEISVCDDWNAKIGKDVLKYVQVKRNGKLVYIEKDEKPQRKFDKK